MPEFSFKDLDKEGLETLLAISKADAFNKWMYETISPYLKGSILEIGSGIGNISGYFLQHSQAITLSDLRENYIDALKNHFSDHSVISGILNIDLVHPEFSKTYKAYADSFDGLFALNVIEHIKDDAAALENAVSLLKPGGTMVILVPAYQWLYNVLDRDLHHYRRYSAKTLKLKMAEAGLLVEKTFYFNALGTAGWLVSGSLLKRRNISPQQMNLFNKIVPLARLLDLLLARSFGLSVICVGRKPGY
jgi:2-polyprenyl-3-methyl-5-hydroxy-6-metoxy-1,4-benzoquinol methylase